MSFIPQRISVGTVSSVTGISGSGTSGQVAYFSGATQLSSQDTFTFNGTDITMTCPTANPLIIKALSGNSNGLRVYCNTASDNASIVNFYNADLEIGTNNTVYQTITGAGVTTFGGNTIARKDQNATTTLQVRNDNAGASAAARVAITSDQGDFSIFANSAAGGDTAALTADATFGGGMDVGILGANPLRLNTNGTTRVTFGGTGAVTFAGAIGIEAGAGSDSMLRVRGNSATSGANQWGIIADTIFSSSGTSSGYTITSQVQTAAASFTANRAAAFQVAAASLGAGSSVTRLINCLLSEQTAGTNNASIADNITFSGNWFINSTSTNPSSLAGQVRVASLGVANSAAATTLGTVTNKIEVFNASGASLGFVPVYDAIT